MAVGTAMLALISLAGIISAIYIPQGIKGSTLNFPRNFTNSTSAPAFRLVTTVTHGNIMFNGSYVTTVRINGHSDHLVAACAEDRLAAETFVFQNDYVTSRNNRLGFIGLSYEISTLDEDVDKICGHCWDITIGHEPICVQTNGFFLNPHNILRYEGDLIRSLESDNYATFDSFAVCRVESPALEQSDNYGHQGSINQLLWLEAVDIDLENPEDSWYREEVDDEWLRRCAKVELKAEFI